MELGLCRLAGPTKTTWAPFDSIETTRRRRISLITRPPQPEFNREASSSDEISLQKSFWDTQRFEWGWEIAKVLSCPILVEIYF